MAKKNQPNKIFLSFVVEVVLATIFLAAGWDGAAQIFFIGAIFHLIYGAYRMTQDDDGAKRKGNNASKK